jgi:5-methylcytosine-specific restriction endonuclease McrA
MAVKCKIERLLTDVQARAQKYYEWAYCGRIAEASEEAMQIITASEASPVALHEHSGLFRVLDPIPYNNRYNNRGIDKYLDSQFFLFRDSIYAATGPYTESECMLLVADLADKERTLFEALSQKQDSPEVREAVADRRRISEKVRIAVWRRDQGQCRKCHSRLNLEYDHIIPVAEGGSNTVRNIELLCEKCNRSKGKKIQ